MKIEKTDNHCLGAFRLAAIDAGHVLHGEKVRLPSGPEAEAMMTTVGAMDQTGVGYDGSDGHRYIAWGTRDEIVKLLMSEGYVIG